MRIIPDRISRGNEKTSASVNFFLMSTAIGNTHFAEFRIQKDSSSVEDFAIC